MGLKIGKKGIEQWRETSFGGLLGGTGTVGLLYYRAVQHWGMQHKIEEKKKQGDLDEVFKKYCG